MHPIVIFDSGVGGLSIYKELNKLMPNHSYCYIFDNENFPYGTLKESKLVSVSLNFILKVVSKVDPCLIVIACNTASTAILPYIRQHVSIPVVGVVPAIKPAVSLSKTNHIALLATTGTINRPYTTDLIATFAPNCQVTLLPEDELVLLAEKKIENSSVDMAKLSKLVQPILKSDIDVVVLGCTHFPILKEELQLVMPNIILLDSGAAIAKRVKSLLASNDFVSEGSQKINMVYYSKNINSSLKKALGQHGFYDTDLI